MKLQEKSYLKKKLLWKYLGRCFITFGTHYSKNTVFQIMCNKNGGDCIRTNIIPTIFVTQNLVDPINIYD